MIDTLFSVTDRLVLVTGGSRGTFSAYRAASLGMVNVVTEPVPPLDAALELLELICDNASLAVREVLGIVNREIADDEDEIWARSGDDAHARLLASRDVAEGVAAFFEHRPPKWNGVEGLAIPMTPVSLHRVARTRYAVPRR